MDPLVITCQQFNVNDNTYKVLEKLYKNGDPVKRGDIVILLDSSKAVIDIEAEGEGFFYTNVKENEQVAVGQPLYIVSEKKLESQSAIDPFFRHQVSKDNQKDKAAAGKMVTKNARRLLEEHKLNENDFAEEIITEELINRYLKSTKQAISLIPRRSNYKTVKRVAFIGAGQGLIQALDVTFHMSEFIPAVVYDDTPEKLGLRFFDMQVAGKVNVSQIKKDFDNGLFDVIINTVSVSIPFRKKIFDSLTALGVPFANLIHPSAYIGFNSTLGTGNVILPHVSIGPCTEIGDDNFISAQCNIEHHNVLGDHCTFGPGVMTSGNVIIGDETKFGTGIFIEPRLSIGKKSMIASGCIINRNVEDQVVAFQQGSKLAFKPIEE